MKTILLFAFCIASLAAMGNMASPIRHGTLSSTAFSSKDIDILKEVLIINLNKDLKTASFSVDYFIHTGTDGKQIPLLFYAENYKNDFKIWVDDKEVMLLEIPYEYRAIDSTPFKGFKPAFSGHEGGDEKTTINWSERSSNSYRLSDLKYFEVSLAKGDHKIHVEYTAIAGEDRMGWVKKYNYPYSLSPAKYWRSFGGLEVILNGTQLAKNITTNLGEPAKGKADSTTIWNFAALPGEVVMINYTPAVNNLAKALISFQPIGLAIIMSLLLTVLHFICIRLFRKHDPYAKHSPVLIMGAIIIPALMLIGYIYAYEMIDDIIGPEASRYHGYTFLALILYPLLFPVYWFIMWLVDKRYRRNVKEQHYT